ncbi:MAG: hypothetical protein Q8P05_01520 [Candidatus Diapherotrites archaeon]|nr:hypothetical protein [Candidatus Diapherotrites archaeon]
MASNPPPRRPDLERLKEGWNAFVKANGGKETRKLLIKWYQHCGFSKAEAEVAVRLHKIEIARAEMAERMRKEHERINPPKPSKPPKPPRRRPGSR